MKSIEIAIMTRLTADTAGTASLQSLLGGSGRISHAQENMTPKSPGVVYRSMSNVPGSIFSDRAVTSQETYLFTIYAANYEDIAYRLRVLLDGYTFADQSDTGGIRCVWDLDGPDDFDDFLMVNTKTVQFKIYMAPKPVAPV